MSVIYLVHPTHGAKVAISETEANYDAMSGWQRYDVDTSTVLADDDDDESVNEMAAPKRRGRPRAKQEG
jgi:hypothetical protein|tara:strand:- start:138 stop:344 length:207 start_codon:yes stop_codon:yes gene_type:complete